MIGKFLARIFIIIIVYLFISSLIFFISYLSLSKKKFIDLPGFRSIQENLYYNGFVDIWQNKSQCVIYDEILIYAPKIGSCEHTNAEFDTVLNFTKTGRLMPTIENNKNKSIIVIGDSHAMGWGVNDDETFSYVLQNISKIQVHNLAVSSYGTVREVMRLEKSGLSDNSDIIIVQYHENDIRENKNFDKLKRKEYKNIYLNMITVKKSTATNIINILRNYKSSLRLIFSDITGFFVKRKKKIDFEPHYIPLVENIKKIKNFNSKKIIIFYSERPEARFYNFPNGFDQNYPNVYFLDINNIGLSGENYFYLDKHPNKSGHEKIGTALHKILKSKFY